MGIRVRMEFLFRSIAPAACSREVGAPSGISPGLRPESFFWAMISSQHWFYPSTQHAQHTRTSTSSMTMLQGRQHTPQPLGSKTVRCCSSPCTRSKQTGAATGGLMEMLSRPQPPSGRRAGLVQMVLDAMGRRVTLARVCFQLLVEVPQNG